MEAHFPFDADGFNSTIQAIDKVIESMTLVEGHLNGARIPLPPQLNAYTDEVRKLRHHFEKHISGQMGFRMAGVWLDYLRTALARDRRRRMEEVNRLQSLVQDSKQLERLNVSIGRLDAYLSNQLKDVQPCPVPRLGDFLTSFGREKVHPIAKHVEAQREPKHRILLSASVLFSDIPVFREHCEDRRKPLAVAFADLDDFKQFNNQLGEVRTDNEVLPPILHAVESASYGHGRAYRHGGDEFVFLLPNAGHRVAAELLREVKAQVELLKFDATPLRPKMSVGVWITYADSHLADRELIHHASLAKQHAKSLGKSQIVIRVENGSGYEESATAR